MKKYQVTAYGDAEEGLSRKTAQIEAKDRNDALNKAWGMFPEYHEISVSEIGGN